MVAKPETAPIEPEERVSHIRVVVVLLVAFTSSVCLAADCSFLNAAPVTLPQGSRDLLLTVNQYSYNIASGGTIGDCPACSYTLQSGQTICAQPRAYAPQTITVVGTTAAGTLFTKQVVARQQPTYTLDAAGNRTPATPPPPYSEMEYPFVADVRSLTAYGPVEVSYSRQKCDNDELFERTCPARAQVSAGINGVRWNDITLMPKCATPPPPPVVTGRRTGNNTATLVVKYAFPATATHRQIVITAAPTWEPGAGQTPAVTLADVRDPQIGGAGPFTINITTPSDVTRYPLEARVFYVDVQNDCAREAYGFTVVAPATGSLSLVDGNASTTAHDPLPPIMGAPLQRRYDSTIEKEGFFGRGWTSVFDQRFAYWSNKQFGDDPWAADYYLRFDLLDNEYAIFIENWDAVTDTYSYHQLHPSDAIVPANVTWDYDNFRVEHRRAFSSLETVFDDYFGNFLGLRDKATGQEAIVTPDPNGTGWTYHDTHTGISWTITLTDDLITSIGTTGGLSWTYEYNPDRNLIRVAGPGNATWRTYEYTNSIMTASRDANGNIIESRTYDQDGRVIASQGPLEDITNIQYGLPGPTPEATVSRVTIATGGTTDVTHDAKGSKFKRIESSGACTTCGPRNLVSTYDEKGRPIRQQTGDGYITLSTYNATHLIKRETRRRPTTCDPATSATLCKLTAATLENATLTNTSASQTIEYEYNDANWPERPTRVTTGSVHTSGTTRDEYTYDATTGQVLTHRTTGWTGQPAVEETRTTTTVLYDGTEGAAFNTGTIPSGAQPRLPKTIDGPRTDVNDITTFVYYPIDNSIPTGARGKLAAIKNALGHITTLADYDLFGNPRRLTDTSSNITELTTDTIGRALTHTVKAVTPCNTAADPVCANDLTTTFTYDGLGQLTSETRPEGNVTTFAYDNRGRLVTASRGPATYDLREQAETIYATTGKLSARRYLEKAVSWVERQRQDYTFNTDGYLVRITYPDTKFLQYDYDPAGRITKIQDENHTAPNTTYTYDSSGQLGKVEEKLGPSLVRATYTYDRHGNLVSVNDPNQNATTFAYDDFGQFLQEVSPERGTTTYAYDLAGNAVTRTDANNATTTTSYDAVNRALTSTATHTGIPAETVTFSYDNGTNGTGRLASTADPTGSTAYTYDRRGLLLREEKTVDGTVYTSNYQYDKSGNRTRITYPSGGIVAYTHDYAGREVTVSRNGTTLVQSASYLPFGPLRELVLGNGTTRTVAHDQRYRTTQNKLSGPQGAIAQYDYAYDNVGNVTAITDAIAPAYNRAFSYDDLSRLVTATTGGALWGSGTFQYDDMGNLRQASLGAAVRVFAHSGTTSRLATVTENDIMKTVTYDNAGNETSVGTEPLTYTARNHLATKGTFAYRYDGRGIRTITTNSIALANVTLSSATVAGGAALQGTVTLTDITSTDAIVSLATNSTAATVPPAVTVLAGSASSTFNITTTPVGATAAATISATISGSTTSATLTVHPARLLHLTLNPASVTGGTPSAGTVTLDGPAFGETTLSLTSDAPTASVPAAAMIPAGASTTSFGVTTMPVSGTTTATIRVARGEEALVQPFTILPPAVLTLAFTPASVYGGQTAEGLVNLSGPAPPAGMAVGITSSINAVSVPPTITIPAAATNATFIAQTVPVDDATTGVVTVALNGTKQATVTIVPATLESLSVAPNPVPGGGTAAATVTLNAPAGPSGATVDLATDNPNVVPIPAAVTVSAGSITGQTALSTNPVSTITAVVLLASHQGTTHSAVLSVEPSPGHGLTVTPSTVVGTESVYVTYRLPAPAADYVYLSVSFFNGGLATGTDPVIAPGGLEASFHVLTCFVEVPVESTISVYDGERTLSAVVQLLPPSGNYVVDLIAELAATTEMEETYSVSATLYKRATSNTWISVSGWEFPGGGVTIPAGQISTTFTAVREMSNAAFPPPLEVSYGGVTRRYPDHSGCIPIVAAPSHSVVARCASLSLVRCLTRDALETVASAQAGVRKYSLYSPGSQLLAETEITSAAAPPIAYEYVWFAGIPVTQVETTTNTLHFYFTDHLGTPLLTTDTSGLVDWRAEREPYGKIYALRAGASRYQPLAFPGQEDDGTDLSYNIARWYRASWGRFLSVDPTWASADLGRPQSWNRYSYVLNNPINHTDPDGRCPAVLDCILVGGATLGSGGTAIVVVGTVLVVGAVSEIEVGGKSIGGHVRDFMLSGGGSSGEMAAETMIQNWSHQKEGEQPGSYTIDFDSGKKYHGKGPESRADASSDRVGKANNDTASNVDWKPATDTKEAFKDEARRIRNDGGVKNPDNYNKINSPGEKLLKEDEKQQ